MGSASTIEVIEETVLKKRETLKIQSLFYI